MEKRYSFTSMPGYSLYLYSDFRGRGLDGFMAHAQAFKCAVEGEIAALADLGVTARLPLSGIALVPLSGSVSVQVRMSLGESERDKRVVRILEKLGYTEFQ